MARFKSVDAELPMIHPPQGMVAARVRALETEGTTPQSEQEPTVTFGDGDGHFSSDTLTSTHKEGHLGCNNAPSSEGFAIIQGYDDAWTRANEFQSGQQVMFW